MSVSNVSDSSGLSFPLNREKTQPSENANIFAENEETEIITRERNTEQNTEATPDLTSNTANAPSSLAPDFDEKKIQEQLESVNSQLSLQSKNLVFEFDDINDPPIVKVIDSESGDVIREIPPKEMRDIAKAFVDIADTLDNGIGLVSSVPTSGILFKAEL